MAGRGGVGGAKELADLGPGEFLVAGVVDGLGQELLGLGDETGQGVEVDGGVAEPVGGAPLGEGIDRLVEDVEARSVPSRFTWPLTDFPRTVSLDCRSHEHSLRIGARAPPS